eukprot:5406922-Alexandrium_andersonii.AAC.1
MCIRDRSCELKAEAPSSLAIANPSVSARARVAFGPGPRSQPRFRAQRSDEDLAPAGLRVDPGPHLRAPGRAPRDVVPVPDAPGRHLFPRRGN